MIALLFVSSAEVAFAASPLISSVTYKTNGSRWAVVFDQAVSKVGGGAIDAADFTLAGASSTGASITSVRPSGAANTTFVLVLSTSSNPTAASQWTIAASSSIQNSGSETASTTAKDVFSFGTADNAAPTVRNVFQHATMALDVMFSEAVDGPSSTSTAHYVSLTTSAAGDTPGISSIQSIPEGTFVILQATASTTLGWGAGNSVDVGSVEDLVGNAHATSTYNIVPSLKISEVKAGTSANSEDEFVEIYNFGDTAVTISTSTFFLHIATSTSVNKPLTLLQTSIPSQGFYLIGSQFGYSGAVSLDATYSSFGTEILPWSGVYLAATSTATTTSGLVIDLLGMGTSTVFESATTSTALPAGYSFERKASQDSTSSTLALGGSEEFKGNSRDTHSNSADFVQRAVPQPQNTGAQKEFPFGGPGGGDTGAPQVAGSFPSGSPGEVVPTSLSFIGWGFTEPVVATSVTTSSVSLTSSAAPSTNLCASVTFNNFPAPGEPSAKCVVSGTLSSSSLHTFKVATSVLDFANNRLNQPANNKGDAEGNYVVTFTPSGAGTSFTFDKPPVMMLGSLPSEGNVNVARNITKIILTFSDNVATSTATTTNITLVKSGGSAVTLSSVSTTASDVNKFASDVLIANIQTGTTLDANSTYVVSINNLQDTSSRPLPPRTVNFTTGASADSSGASVVGKIPSAATGVSVNAIDIRVAADDRLDPSTITSSTVQLKVGANEVPGQVRFDPFSGEIIFLANNIFQADTSYTVQINATGTTPCVQNVSGLCLLDTDGTANGSYQFSFTTGAADTTGPQVISANADQRHLSVTFDEPLKETEAKTFANYTLLVNGSASSLSANAGHAVFYDPMWKTVSFDNLTLAVGATFSVTVSGVHDLAGNLINSTASSSVGTVQSMGMTGGMVGPGGPSPTDFIPTNFSSSTYSFVPQVMVRPFNQTAGVQTSYFIGLPISQQVKASGSNGKIIFTFPTGFDVTSAGLDAFSPAASDANEFGPGTLVPTVAANATARTVTITLSSSTRCGSGNGIGCGGDTHDFLRFDISGITNSSIPKDGSTNGYTVDVKTFDGTTVLESFTSQAFHISAGGSNALVVAVNASGASSGTSTVILFSPLNGPQQKVTSAFAGGVATATFTGLVSGSYELFTPPIISLGGTDYIGRATPTSVFLTGNTTTTATLTFTSTVALTSVTVQVTGPSGKNIDVFANSGDTFVVKSTSTTGSAQNVVLKLSNGTWYVGVGPQIPKGYFEGKPPAPDFVLPQPVQVTVSGSSVLESSGTANDGTIVVTLGSAALKLTGTVKDGNAKAVVGAEVFAFSPLGGFGTHGSTDAGGNFSLSVGAGVYQVGVFAHGLPPASETVVEVKSNGTMVVNGQTVTSVALKLIKPERTIGGQVLDQDNNAVQDAGVYAYCDPSVSANACFGPGDHTYSPTGSDGSYTLYVKSGTWKVGAFMPGFGSLPEVQKVVTSSDITGLNFSPSTNTTFNTIAGTVCKDDHASGNATTCGSGDTKLSGVFVRAVGASSGNQTVTAQDGTYTVKIPSGTYGVEAFDPTLGRLKPLSNVDASSSVTGKDFVVGNPNVITITAKDSAGNAVTVTDLFIDFYDFTNDFGNHAAIRNAASTTISLPSGDYRMRASMKGKIFANADIQSDSGSTAVSTSTATTTVNGVEAIKVIIPTLATITGNVYVTATTSGNELTDALVQFSNPSAGVFLSVQPETGSSTYSIKIPAGTYKILAQKPGYIASPVEKAITVSTTIDIVVSQAVASISGTINIDGSPATKGFVRAKSLGGGFASDQVESDGTYSLSVGNGVWRVFAVSEGYQETEYSATVLVSGSAVTGININLTTKVSLTAPKTCLITPSQGGECEDTANGIKVTILPNALGTDTKAATVTIKETNALQQTSGMRPVGKGFEFSAVDNSGSKITTFSVPVVLEFTQTTSTLAASSITTVTKADAMKLTLWSETIKDYDVLLTTVEYLNSSDALVTSPNENLTNVDKIRMKAPATHF